MDGRGSTADTRRDVQEVGELAAGPKNRELEQLSLIAKAVIEVKPGCQGDDIPKQKSAFPIIGRSTRPRLPVKPGQLLLLSTPSSTPPRRLPRSGHDEGGLLCFLELDYSQPPARIAWRAGYLQWMTRPTKIGRMPEAGVSGKLTSPHRAAKSHGRSG